MTTRVPAHLIEAKVGVTRHARKHYARAISAEHTVYILHSDECLATGRDLNDCAYSQALDKGIDTVLDRWTEDVTTVVTIDAETGVLVPIAGPVAAGRGAAR